MNLALQQSESRGAGQGWRADIDALRALAVGLVLLYHFEFRPITGGFIGVDIFFVLSGFLITRIIVGDLEQNRFSFVDFYARRVRRILPALSAVILVSLVAALLILLPSDFARFATSSLSALFSVSNIFFWRQSGYFGEPAQLQPMLHTWSLGIEEQVYLLLPLLLWATVRWTPKRHHRKLIVGMLAVSALVSLMLAEFAIRSGKAGPAFFLMPTRWWELVAGGLLAIGVVAPPPNRVVASVAAIAGFGAILWAALTYHGEMGFPGLAAVPPVGGTLLLLWAGQKRHLLYSLMTLRPILFMGLISYSLYLWHWPLLSFARYISITPLPGTVRALLLGLSFLLAILCWRFIESPLRHGAKNTRRVLLFFAGTAAITILALVLVPRLERFPPEVERMNASAGTMWKCSVSDYIPLGSYYGCPLNLPDRDPRSAEVVLWGDSHAQMHVPGVLPALQAVGLKGLLVPQNGCAPLVGPNRGAVCVAQASANLAQIDALPNVKVVVLGLYWQNYLTGLTGADDVPTSQSLLDAMEQTIDRLHAKGRHVILIGPTAVPRYDVASDWSRAMAFDRQLDRPKSISRAAFDAETRGVADFLARMRQREGVTVVDLVNRLCTPEECPFIVEGQALHGDGNHLSTRTAATLSLEFEAVFRAAKRSD